MIKEIKSNDQLNTISGGVRQTRVITSSGSDSSRASFSERLAAFRARTAESQNTVTITSEPRVDTTSGQTIAPRSSFRLTSSGRGRFRAFGRTSELDINIEQNTQ